MGYRPTLDTARGMLMFKATCGIRSRLEYTICPGQAWDHSISKQRKCCKYHSKCNYQNVINTTLLAATMGGFSCFRCFWQRAESKLEVNPNVWIQNQVGMAVVWAFFFFISSNMCLVPGADAVMEGSHSFSSSALVKWFGSRNRP